MAHEQHLFLSIFRPLCVAVWKATVPEQKRKHTQSTSYT